MIVFTGSCQPLDRLFCMSLGNDYLCLNAQPDAHARMRILLQPVRKKSKVLDVLQWHHIYINACYTV